MAPDSFKKEVWINGHKWMDVTNETVYGQTYTYEEAKSISFWPYRGITSSDSNQIGDK